MIVEPVTLAGRVVRLEPMTLAHVDPLTRIGLVPDLWRWTSTLITTPEDMRTYVATAVDELRQGLSLPFVVKDRASGLVIGSTRYANISPQNRRLEIGWTWLAPQHQRTGANTEAKLLLLTHAFETLGTIRVEFKTDVLNQKSRQALLRIGAVEEGTFRKHIITDSGRVRDTVYFSILDTEWPDIRTRLRKLCR